ncbi:Di-copper centre-containing protein [Sistotremastrum niveocremeum HHB9708]|uniref:tyrosinase n=1 Tax=Sistotremastrum niveocremeum HHB9708 TaxID=1314777 RepID=A0A164PTJ8_9AGAM|nr:Di-copper centre-containing protein [Sistotremastrum niveocremeum HHB9708]
MAPPTFPIKGIQEDLGPLPGQTPLRQEIDAWSSDPKNQVQVALFMLALEAFQKIPYHDRLSYFQIAGIHGLPLVPWDEDTTTQTPGTTLGYCTHGSILFPAWHRPYVALFEQRLYEIMIEVIIPRFPPATHAALVAQAKAWRLPYWDWAAKKVDPNDPSAPPNYNLPQLVTQPGGRIFGPEGIEIEFPNPLNTFVADEPMGEYGIVDIGNAPVSVTAVSSVLLPLTEVLHLV